MNQKSFPVKQISIWTPHWAIAPRYSKMFTLQGLKGKIVKDQESSINPKNRYFHRISIPSPRHSKEFTLQRLNGKW